jgi:two-component system cell cycle response regulator
MQPAVRKNGARASIAPALRRDTEPCNVVESLQHAATFRRNARAAFVLLELVGAEPGAVFRVVPPGVSLGRLESDGALVFRDATVSAVHARIHLDDGVVVVEDLASRNGTFVNDTRVAATARLADGDYVRLGSTVLKFSMMAQLEEGVLRTMFDRASHDALTGLYNRRYFDERLASELSFARRHDMLLGLLLMDIDHFKQVNDQCGHASGDAVLRVVSGSIQRLMRPEDVLSRYGGEEFTAILRATSLRNLQILGQRVCHHVETLAPVPSHDLSVTVSVGVSLFAPDRGYASGDAMVAAADVALYAAKAQGGNRVVLSSAPG